MRKRRLKVPDSFEIIEEAVMKYRNTFLSFTQSTIHITQQDDYTGQRVEFKARVQVKRKDFTICSIRLWYC